MEFIKCILGLEHEVQRYGPASREQINTTLLFADNQAIAAEDKDDAEYMAKK
jgi:hypothetical protein